MPTQRGSIHLIRLAGIDVYLHWSWFLLALWGIQDRAPQYSSYLWPFLEYVSLFLIVTMHEFGHALACKSVQGRADTIVLWPFGGVAYVSPPPRPGATLWCIAAGPLVNVVLLPIFYILVLLARSWHWPELQPDAFTFIRAIFYIDLVLLIFNMLPIYPLDGGQILQSLLWFIFGRATSLMIAASIGFVGVGLLLLFAFWASSIYLAVMAGLVGMYCWSGLQRARGFAKLAKLPRHTGLACPFCGETPPEGPFWRCGRCRTPYDVFNTNGVCPSCGTISPNTPCFHCGRASPIESFRTIQV